MGQQETYDADPIVWPYIEPPLVHRKLVGMAALIASAMLNGDIALDIGEELLVDLKFIEGALK